MPAIDIGDARLDYVERGTGEPVVLVHGSASDRRTWDALMGVAPARVRLLAYSRRYHWPSPPIAADVDYAAPQHVDDLESMLDAIGAGPVHLVGHSYGALVAILLALRRPAIVRSLVLVEAPVLTLFSHHSGSSRRGRTSSRTSSPARACRRWTGTPCVGSPCRCCSSRARAVRRCSIASTTSWRPSCRTCGA